MFRKSFYLLAALTVAVGVSLIIGGTADASPILSHIGVTHDPVFHASAALIALRLEHDGLITRAKAKFAEMVDGLAPDAARKIETDHAELVRLAAAKATEITAEETRLANEAAVSAKPWAAGFYASAETSGLSLTDLNKIVLDSKSHEAAKDALIASMAVLNANKPKPGSGHVTVGMESREKFIEGATRAIMGKSPLLSGNKDAERNEFSGRRLFELARMSLEVNGVRKSYRDDFDMIGNAMAPVIMAGALSSSDFVNILANVANKSMLKGYEEAAETFDKWTGTGSLSDFKTVSRVDLGLFPNLAKVEEGAEYTMAKMSDRGITLALATYGKMFPITRQAIINDDLNAFTKIPAKMGRASKRTVGNLVYAILTGNPTLPDSVALFHATHKNLVSGGGSALSVSSLDTARASMAKQTDKDAIAAGLNIRPKYLLTPVALQGSAHQIMASQTEPGQSNAALANRVANMAEVISDARLDVASTTAWYLAGDPSQYDTIEVSYLNGNPSPVLEQKEGWNVDGVEFKVRLDAGVNVLDFIALYKSAGA